MDLMRAHDLFAVGTAFKPKAKRWDSSARKCVCNASYIDKDRKKRPRRLDHICVSNRWKSMIKNTKIKWGPSEHRFGRKFDHGLVSAIWHWRTKKAAKFVTPNFNAMTNQSWERFDKDLRIRLQRRDEARANTSVIEATAATRITDRRCVGAGDRSKASTEYSSLTEEIKRTIDEVVPKKKNLFRNDRSISEETNYTSKEEKRM